MKKTKAKPETEEQKPKPEPVQKIREEIKQVKYTFSNQEMLDLGKDLAGKTTDLSNVVDEAKSVAKSYKSKEAEIEGAIGVLTEKIKTGYELRPMKCRVVFRSRDGKKDYFRADTGELALTEQMTNADLQMDLELENKKQANDENPDAKIKPGEGLVTINPKDLEASQETISSTIEIWPDALDSMAQLTLYRVKGLWTFAIQANVGDWVYFSPINTSEKGSKERYDAIKRAMKLLRSEMEAGIGEAADGFHVYIDRVLEAEAGKVE